MHSKQQFPNVTFGARYRPESAALAIMLMLLFLMFVFLFMTLIAQPAQAQTYNVIHNFTDGQDGGTPFADLTMDKAGNLYGTAIIGGSGGHGTVFQLKQSGSNWIFNVLYGFPGGSSGAYPQAGLIFGPNGTLYGTTANGGGNGYGTTFNLRPSPSACKTVLCSWTETVLYAFEGGPSDGANPEFGDLIFDQEGNLYGTTYGGGTYGYGTVFQLTPSGSGWTESILYAFSGSDGAYPNGVIFDNAGNLYGTTANGGGNGYGTVFQLTPSGSGWTEQVLYSFQDRSDGGYPIAGLIFDPVGNLYGATLHGGSGGGGTVFKLTPSSGSWTYSLVYSFTGGHPGYGGAGPIANLAIDGAGNLYGTTAADGAYDVGTVFKLTPSGGSWTYTSLHDFTGGSDGGYPESNVTFDANGNLYGTASEGGSQRVGVVWEITP